MMMMSATLRMFTTDPNLSNGLLPDILCAFEQCALKIRNEAVVVEGMGSIRCEFAR